MKKATAAILIKDNKVMIAKREKEDRFGGKWEFPGGKFEEGETPEECLTREIKEELCIDIEVGDFFDENKFSYSKGDIHLLAYYIKHISGEIKLNVHDDIVFVNRDEILKYDFLEADKLFIKKLIKDCII
ncbi:8-oxo-dGTP diphosphatase MutT [Clostridium sediminicola]|uniref:(deoxy)nucleoside triphosphate pyrophosphohydrolase n=1 Tax=Clostridium sediminicola TaxID=3114879 RepID=UPI0031F23B46